jgi:Amt family ammonium transporter
MAAAVFATRLTDELDAAVDRALAGPDNDAPDTVAEFADVASRAGARVAELRDAERRLRELLAEAVHANQAKAEFLANMSHELRTPLNAIVGFAEFLQIRVGKQIPERERGYLDDIIQAAFHLLAVIQEILDFSRLEAGKLAVQDEKFRLAEAVDGAVRLVRKQAEAKRVALVETLDDTVRVLADPTKLRQIAANLVTNAVKFTPPGGRVDVWCGVDPEGRACLRVADSGVGMTPAEIEMALKPFMRVATSPFVAKEGGVGLGLPISKALVELHGGTLLIASEPRKGTVATVVLPPERRATA